MNNDTENSYEHYTVYLGSTNVSTKLAYEMIAKSETEANIHLQWLEKHPQSGQQAIGTMSIYFKNNFKH